MPGPYRAAVGKLHAVHKRPRRGQDPSLRTAPSTSARRPYRACVNDIRRAGCPHPAASSRGCPSTGSHPRRGRRPRRPGNLLLPPIPGHLPGRACPAPTARRRASPMPSVGRGQDPSLRTAPSTSARTPPQVRAAARQRAATHVGGGVLDAPEASRHRPSPGKPPGRACPAPTARRWASPMPSVNAHGGVKTPSLQTAPSTSARPPAARRCGNGDKKTEAIPFPGTASVLYISI